MFYAMGDHLEIFRFANATTGADNHLGLGQINATFFSFFIAAELDLSCSIGIDRDNCWATAM